MLPAGTRVGAYRIVSFIDHGGFAEVYRAQSIRDGRVVALKVISRNQDEELIAAERLGASLQARFEHAHGMVPRTFDVDQDEHYFYIAMACVEGPCLAAEIARGPVDPVRAARHAVLICRFLERAHRFATEIDRVRYDKLIHADLKPSHIFISNSREDTEGHGGSTVSSVVGGITVLDFGIAKALENSRTAKTIRFVTPLYASPQRLDTGRGSEQDDLWALAVILYEMVRGTRPHSAIEDPPAYSRVSRAIGANAERAPLPPSCPPGLAAIIDRGLRYQEDLRYESAAAMRADLETFLRNESPSALKRFATPPTIKAGSAVVPTLPRPADPALTPSVGEVRLKADATGGVVASRGVTGESVASGFSRTSPVAVIDPPAPTVVVRRPGIVRRAARLGMLIVASAVFTSEAGAWLAAERMRADLRTLDVRGVAAMRQQYERLRRRSVFHVGQRLRVDPRLEPRLVAAADAVIADYRQEDSTVAEAQWRQAREALEWASQLAPHDARIAPKQLICQGHLDRIAAQTRSRTRADARRLYDLAIAEFERAGRLDPQAADPYLGLGRIYIYARSDVDRGTAAIHEAEARGHTPGWRERALLGDGYRQRADTARRIAARSPEEAQRETLERARDDYARCVDVLTPILDKARSRYNRDYCQRHLDVLNQALAPEAAAADRP